MNIVCETTFSCFQLAEWRWWEAITKNRRIENTTMDVQIWLRWPVLPKEIPRKMSTRYKNRTQHNDTMLRSICFVLIVQPSANEVTIMRRTFNVYSVRDLMSTITTRNIQSIFNEVRKLITVSRSKSLVNAKNIQLHMKRSFVDSEMHHSAYLIFQDLFSNLDYIILILPKLPMKI